MLKSRWWRVSFLELDKVEVTGHNDECAYPNAFPSRQLGGSSYVCCDAADMMFVMDHVE